MNQTQTNPDSASPNRSSRKDIDSLLRDYFAAEMPATWPDAPVPLDESSSRSVSWWRKSRRNLAIAAAITLVFAGYWAVSGLFPSLSFSPREYGRQGVIGRNLEGPTGDAKELMDSSVDKKATDEK